MLTNAYLLAKIGADTAANEQHFAEILSIGRCVADRRTDTLAAAGMESTWADASEREREAARAMDLGTLLTARQP